MKTDPIELELFRHMLVSIAEEMGAVLRKTSYSANRGTGFPAGEGMARSLSS